MADDNPYGEYHRRPSFIKVFSGSRNKEELRLPPQWVAEYGTDLPVDCQLVMPNGNRWQVRLIQIASGCHFCVGWSEFRLSNNISHGEKLTFTLVDVGIFHNIVVRPARTNICELGLTEEEEDNEVYAPDIESSDDNPPSGIESDTTDDSDYDADTGALADDEYPTWTLKLTKSNTKRTIEIPNAFWQLHLAAAPQQNVVHLLVAGQTWRLIIKHSSGKIWVKHGWRRFKDANALFPGVRCHFKLVDARDIQFYVWFDRP
ncbi:B3 domain-containing protein REM20-like [Salvia splendens]|uniref:B3 domain-containing protein REM20-like n=1 Tax=Salvia splendens TaxID=180675 RepID=UPI001C26D0B5|nr:B3 domain-containing protein REM20-like [Salvia splendens]